MYGKPVIPTGQQFQPQASDSPYPEHPYAPETEPDHNLNGSLPAEHQETERMPRPLSPTKLMPFISNPYRNQSDMDLEALRKKLYNAPRPLKKRSSITEPEGPTGPNIQKLLYQKTTLAAMETTTNPPKPEAEANQTPEPPPPPPLPLEKPEPQILEQPQPDPPAPTNVLKIDGEDFIPPPPPSHPAPRPEDAFLAPLPPPLEIEESIPSPSDNYEEFPPYPPPPYPSGADQEALGEDTFNMKPPEVMSQVPLPPVSMTILLFPISVSPSMSAMAEEN